MAELTRTWLNQMRPNLMFVGTKPMRVVGVIAVFVGSTMWLIAIGTAIQGHHPLDSAWAHHPTPVPKVVAENAIVGAMFVLAGLTIRWKWRT